MKCVYLLKAFTMNKWFGSAETGLFFFPEILVVEEEAALLTVL